MFPRLRRRTATRPWPLRQALRGRRIVVGLVVVLTLVLVGCGGTAFDPTGACTADGSTPGAYPDLEAAIPKLYKDAKPSNLDSGRACSASGLGTLAGHGVKELRFAGGTWSTGTDSGLSLAVFTSPDGSALNPAWLIEFFEAGARTAKNVTSVDTTEYAVTTAITGKRIDVLNGESYQSIVVWEKDGRIAVALVGDFIREIQTKEAHDLIVRRAVDTMAG
jgi:hypothetical protein